MTLTVLYGDQVMWKGPQRDMFRKYPQQRERSMAAISAAVATAVKK